MRRSSNKEKVHGMKDLNPLVNVVVTDVRTKKVLVQGTMMFQDFKKEVVDRSLQFMTDIPEHLMKLADDLEAAEKKLATPKAATPEYLIHDKS